MVTPEELREIISEELGKFLSKLKPEESKNIDKKYLTQGDVSRLYHVSKQSLITWAKTGQIKAYRLNGRVLYKEDEIDKLLLPIKTKGGDHG